MPCLAVTKALCWCGILKVDTFLHLRRAVPLEQPERLVIESMSTPGTLPPRQTPQYAQSPWVHNLHQSLTRLAWHAGATGPVQQLESSPDNPRILASLAASGHTQIWDLQHERQICSLAMAATCMVTLPACLQPCGR